MNAVLDSRKQEYQLHFARGKIYVGLAPVIVYWACSIGCFVGTSGIGAFVCSLAANGAEVFMAKIIAPPMSNRLFDRAACTPD
jgi:hypothetical protein